MQKEQQIMTGSDNEREAIALTVQMYVAGGRSGRSADMKSAFHPAATIYGYIGPELFGGPIQLLFDWNDKNGPAKELQSRIASIDVEESIATVRLELDNWTGHKFTDMFTLLKTGGAWKIMSKVFYLHPEN
jgi:putative lumazine-binding protein